MTDLKFYINHFMREREGEKILNNVKHSNKIAQFLLKIKSILKR